MICVYAHINICVCLKMSLMKGQQFSGQKMTCFWGGDFVWFQRYQPDPRFRDQRISFFVNSVLPFDLTFWLKLNFQIYSSYWTWNIFHFFVWKNRFNVIFVPMAIWSIFCYFPNLNRIWKKWCFPLPLGVITWPLGQPSILWHENIMFFKGIFWGFGFILPKLLDTFCCQMLI